MIEVDRMRMIELDRLMIVYIMRMIDSDLKIISDWIVVKRLKV